MTRLRMWHGAALLAVLASTAFARQQVLKNGSYEAADPNTLIPFDWTQFGGAGQSGVFSFDGLSSALASIQVNAFVGMFQDPVQVEENVRILMKAMAYIPSAAPITGAGAAGIKLEFFEPEGLEVPDPEENLAFEPNNPAYAENTWIQVSYSTTVPEDIDIARIIMISFDTVTTNGPVYCDAAHAEFGSAPGVNQLLNPSFESGPGGLDGLDDWTEFADALSGARKNAFEVPAVDGTNVLKCLGLTCGLRQDLVVTPGDTLTISAWFRSNGANPYANPNARAGVKVEWIAGSVPSPNIDIRSNDNPISGTTNTLTSASPTDVWQPVTIDYTMPPASAAKLRATIITGFGPATTDVYFDAFEFVLANVFDGSDADGDNDEDMADIAALQQAFTGSGGGMVYGGLVFDHDEDEDVDSSDSSFTLVRMTGPATE